MAMGSCSTVLQASDTPRKWCPTYQDQIIAPYNIKNTRVIAPDDIQIIR